MAPNTCTIFSGITYWNRNSVARPSAKTLMVCVNVTIAPRNTACLNVPRDPTRYAATMVLPCPGVNACAAPRTNAAAIPTRIIHGVISRSCNKRDRKSPRTTTPGGAGVGVAAAGGGPTGARVGCGSGAITVGLRWPRICRSIDHFNSARRSCGGAIVGSGGYCVRPWLTSRLVWLARSNAAPSSARITISFQPARSGKFRSSYASVPPVASRCARAPMRNTGRLPAPSAIARSTLRSFGWIGLPSAVICN